MQLHHVCAGALLVAQATAFVPCPANTIRSGPGLRGSEAFSDRRPAPVSAALGLRCEMTKIELSATQRMTKGYDKLCKNCPTRLQPRVDTLTEVLRRPSCLLAARLYVLHSVCCLR